MRNTSLLPTTMLLLLLLMMMMMMATFISTGPLPAPPQHSRPDELNSSSHLVLHKDDSDSSKNLSQTDETSFPGNDGNRSTFILVLPQNQLDSPPSERINFHSGCRLSLCVVTKLGENLQAGGDERAEGAVHDPLGPGK
ncbi:uncharacterized protein FYW61_020757 isoform 1-T1 [Anableps anableps]